MSIDEQILVPRTPVDFNWMRRCACGLGATVVCGEGRFLDLARSDPPRPELKTWQWYACDAPEHQRMRPGLRLPIPARIFVEVLTLAEFDDLLAHWDERWQRDRQQKTAAAILLEPEAP